MNEHFPQPEVTREQMRVRLAELQKRYDELQEKFADQEFAIVWRVEGDPDWQAQRSGLNPQLVGTWYTDSWGQVTNRYIPEIETLSGKPSKIYALVVPKTLLENREDIDKGLSQINIRSQELRDGRTEITREDNKPLSPNLDTYLHQFGFTRELESLKQQLNPPTSNTDINIEIVPT